MGKTVVMTINGAEMVVPAGITVAAALALAGEMDTRRSARGEPRAPLCGMGICHECRATIDGRQHQLSCQVTAAEGMRVAVHE